jgi:hypothetical protein
MQSGSQELCAQRVLIVRYSNNLKEMQLYSIQVLLQTCCTTVIPGEVNLRSPFHFPWSYPKLHFATDYATAPLHRS